VTPSGDLSLSLTECSPKRWRRVASSGDELVRAPDSDVVLIEGYEHEAVRSAKKFMRDAAHFVIFGRDARSGQAFTVCRLAQAAGQHPDREGFVTLTPQCVGEFLVEQVVGAKY
jgi:hypothetical protein